MREELRTAAAEVVKEAAAYAWWRRQEVALLLRRLQVRVQCTQLHSHSHSVSRIHRTFAVTA